MKKKEVNNDIHFVLAVIFLLCFTANISSLMLYQPEATRDLSYIPIVSFFFTIGIALCLFIIVVIKHFERPDKTKMLLEKFDEMNKSLQSIFDSINKNTKTTE